jgi:hypothetical protein
VGGLPICDGERVVEVFGESLYRRVEAGGKKGASGVGWEAVRLG